LPKQDDREACQLRRPEIDLLATYDFTRHLQGYAGYSHFFPGEFIRKTGPSRDSDFFYGAIQYYLGVLTSQTNNFSAELGLAPEPFVFLRKLQGSLVALGTLDLGRAGIGPAESIPARRRVTRRRTRQ
jgi:hypothetical protein